MFNLVKLYNEIYIFVCLFFLNFFVKQIGVCFSDTVGKGSFEYFRVFFPLWNCTLSSRLYEIVLSCIAKQYIIFSSKQTKFYVCLIIWCVYIIIISVHKVLLRYRMVQNCRLYLKHLCLFTHHVLTLNHTCEHVHTKPHVDDYWETGSLVGWNWWMSDLEAPDSSSDLHSVFPLLSQTSEIKARHTESTVW